MAERVLVVDDEANMRWVLQEALAQAGYEVATSAGGEEALQQMAQTPADLVILDLKLKGMDGLATLRRLHERWPQVVVIILTAYGTVATAVEAMHLGAADYLRKPFDVEEVRFKLQRALERKALQSELQRLRQSVHGAGRVALAGSHPIWQRSVEQVRSLTALDLDVLFLGEAGSGKRALARLAHALSERGAAPLVEVDLRTVPDEIQQAVLAGQGGADDAWSRSGAGSLLLCHVERLHLEVWTALRERQTQSGRRRPRLLLTAERAPDGGINMAEVLAPPLRDRAGDLPLLARSFAPDAEVTPAALEALAHYAWPGNVAELRGVIDRAMALAAGHPIDVCHLPREVCDGPAAETPMRLPPEGLSLEAVEIALLRQALELAGGNKTRAAELLGLTRHTLLYRLEKYELDHHG
jgi:DNA-binding NtrC family response regulator